MFLFKVQIKYKYLAYIICNVWKMKTASRINAYVYTLRASEKSDNGSPVHPKATSFSWCQCKFQQWTLWITITSSNIWQTMLKHWNLFSILGTIERCNNNTKYSHKGNQCGDHSYGSYQTIMSTYVVLFGGLVPLEYQDIYLNINPYFCLWMNENWLIFQSEFLN